MINHKHTTNLRSVGCFYHVGYCSFCFCSRNKFLNCVHAAAERWQQLDELLPLACCCAVMFCVTKRNCFGGWLFFHGEKALLFLLFLFFCRFCFRFIWVWKLLERHKYSVKMCNFVLKIMSVSPVGCLSKVCRLLPSFEHGLEVFVFIILNGMYPVFDPSQRIFRDPPRDRAPNSVNRGLRVKLKLLQTDVLSGRKTTGSGLRHSKELHVVANQV